MMTWVDGDKNGTGDSVVDDDGGNVSVALPGKIILFTWEASTTDEYCVEKEDVEIDVSEVDKLELLLG